MKTEPQQQVEGARMVRMAAEKLDCHACHLPLKHPIFKVRSNNQCLIFFFPSLLQIKVLILLRCLLD